MMMITKDKCDCRINMVLLINILSILFITITSCVCVCVQLFTNFILLKFSATNMVNSSYILALCIYTEREEWIRPHQGTLVPVPHQKFLCVEQLTKMLCQFSKCLQCVINLVCQAHNCKSQTIHSRNCFQITNCLRRPITLNCPARATSHSHNQ